MKISSQEEYGLRCILQIAKLTLRDDLASLENIAANEHITTDYAAKLLSILRESNLVESVRGTKGGYRLKRPPEKISLNEIVKALSGELFETASCDQFPGNDSKCVHITCCSIRSVWFSVSSILSNILNQVTLRDLLEKEDILSKYLKKQIVPTGF